ncbi:MAG: poly(ribitol-phosphate) beta-N-acetylglucosaminyltransferase, partial [Nocardioidaceae bacterium]|nr:poly(ribitol-phosphate) beta-N-acetylglucosaminyltransferase [Nocardioidaceae bacterium]
MVVPAYNAGPYLERCLQSLLEQTLDRSRYDVIVVDDGSTDGTGERLDRAAREHPGLIRVEHIANSGWPGRPRNLGTDLSTREYVFYCDADDWLLPDALRIMLDRAITDNADIVLVRPVGNRRAVPQALYESGDYCTSWRETPGVFGTLTCQRAFRREFLREQDVRFAEGRVRLEDYLFMTKAYLRSERISIVGSQPCYVFERRDDGANLTSSTSATEDEYFDSVEKIIDIVLAETEPGPQQDVALDRVVRSEVIGPLSRPPLLRKPPEVQAEALAHGRRLLATKVPASAVARLDVLTRHRARLVERGDLAAITRQIESDEAVTLSAFITEVSWEDTRLQVGLALAMERGDEVVYLERDGDTLIRPRPSADDEPVDVTTTFARSGGRVHLRSRDHSEEWRVAVTVQAAAEDAAAGQPLQWSGTVSIDPLTAAGGKPLRPGVWDVLIAFGSCGYSRTARPRLPEGRDEVEPPTVVQAGRRMRPYWTQKATLALSMRVAAPAARPAPAKPRSEKTTVTTSSSRTMRR